MKIPKCILKLTAIIVVACYPPRASGEICDAAIEFVASIKDHGADVTKLDSLTPSGMSKETHLASVWGFALDSFLSMYRQLNGEFDAKEIEDNKSNDFVKKLDLEKNYAEKEDKEFVRDLVNHAVNHQLKQTFSLSGSVVNLAIHQFRSDQKATAALFKNGNTLVVTSNAAPVANKEFLKVGTIVHAEQGAINRYIDKVSGWKSVSTLNLAGGYCEHCLQRGAAQTVKKIMDSGQTKLTVNYHPGYIYVLRDDGSYSLKKHFDTLSNDSLKNEIYLIAVRLLQYAGIPRGTHTVDPSARTVTFSATYNGSPITIVVDFFP